MSSFLEDYDEASLVLSSRWMGQVDGYLPTFLIPFRARPDREIVCLRNTWDTLSMQKRRTGRSCSMLTLFQLSEELIPQPTRALLRLAQASSRCFLTQWQYLTVGSALEPTTSLRNGSKMPTRAFLEKASKRMKKWADFWRRPRECWWPGACQAHAWTAPIYKKKREAPSPKVWRTGTHYTDAATLLPILKKAF